MGRIKAPFFIPVLVFLIFGILIGSLFPDERLLLVLVTGAGFLFAFYRPPLWAAAGIVFMMTGIFLIQVRLAPFTSEGHIGSYATGEKLEITGQIASFATRSGRKGRVALDTISVKPPGGDVIPVTGRINLNIYDPLTHPLFYGDRIRFKGKLKKFRNFNNPGGFDYEAYMLLKGISAGVSVSGRNISFVEGSSDLSFTSRIMRNIEVFRKGYTQLVDKTVKSQKSAAILNALAAGKKDRIDNQLRDVFARSGASHILAISGLHLSILALFFYKLFHGFSGQFRCLLIDGKAGKIAGILTLIPLLFYALLSGFSPSTQRALIMIAMVMTARIIDRDSDVVNTLAFAGVLILLFDCGALFTISFQLSFTAVAFIIAGIAWSRSIKEFQPTKITHRFMLFVQVTLWASIGTFPLIMYYFGMISISQVITNLVVIPLMGFIALPLGFFSMAVFPLSQNLSAWLIELCAHILSFSISLIENISQWPFAWFRSGTLTMPELLLVYATLCVIFAALLTRQKKILLLLVPFLALGIIDTGVWIKKRFFNSDLSLVVLDVGQGNSALLSLPRGKRILIDGGGFSYGSSFDTGRHLVAPYLWREKIGLLDAVVLTHPDADHLNGLVFIMDRFRIKQVFKNSDTDSSKAYEDFIKTCRKRNVPVTELPDKRFSPDFLSTDDIALVFFPDEKSSSTNDNSVVMKVSYDEISMLLPGDISEEREKLLCERFQKSLQANVMLAPHHGSRLSSSDFFLDIVQCESIIVSCGWRNRYGFPSPDVLSRCSKRNIDVFRTDLHGAVEVKTDGQRYTVVTME